MVHHGTGAVVFEEFEPVLNVHAGREGGAHEISALRVEIEVKRRGNNAAQCKMHTAAHCNGNSKEYGEVTT